MIDPALLNDIPLFRDLSAEERAALAPLVTVRPVAAGEMLFKAGDARRNFFVVLSGQLHIFRKFGDEVQTLALLDRNEFVVETALINPTEHHEHNGEMFQAGQVLEIDGRQFASFRKFNPVTANRIYERIIVNVTNRLHHVNNKLVTIFATGKIASTYDNLENLTDLLLDTILSIIHAKRALFAVFRPLEDRIEIVDAKGYHNNQDVKNLALMLSNDPILGALAKLRRDVSVSEIDYRNEPAFHTPYASQTMLGTPLMVGNDVLGAILLGDKQGAAQFSHNNMILLHVIGRQVAASVGSAVLGSKTSQAS